MKLTQRPISLTMRTFIKKMYMVNQPGAQPPEGSEKLPFKFEGHVVRVRGKNSRITVRMVDVNEPDSPEIQTGLRVARIRPEERARIAVGARFTWNQKKPGDTGDGIDLTFRRDEPFTEAQLAEVKAVAARLREQFGLSPTQFKGHIVNVEETSFRVQVENVNDPNAPEMETDIKIDDIKPEDRHYITPGAMFTWTFNTREGSTGSNIKFSTDVWTQDELAKVEGDARALYEGWMADAENENVERK